MSSIRILVVDDCEPWRRFVSSMIERESQLQTVGEASDGLGAILMAKELKPDLILLDIGLPKLNGIDAARQMRRFTPESKILFLSQESSADVAREALEIGAGSVLKQDAGKELLFAVKAVIRGGQFLSSRFTGGIFEKVEDVQLEGISKSELSSSSTHAR